MYDVCKQCLSDNYRVIITFLICKLVHILNFFICKQLWNYFYVKESCAFGYIYLLCLISFFECFIFALIVEKLMMVKKITVIHMKYKTFMVLAIMGENTCLFLSYIFYIGVDEFKHCSPTGEPHLLFIGFGIFTAFFFIMECYFAVKYVVEWYKNKDLDYDDKY